jgi:hypothetical protein
MKRTEWFTYIAIVTLVLFAALRGHPGVPNPKELQLSFWQTDGPFELSPERGRFALTYALAEHNSVFLDVDLARFASPDVGYTGHRYTSLFAPAVSYIAVPFYVVGKYMGLTQISSFLSVVLFAVLNFILIVKICSSLGIQKFKAFLAGLLFIFATPAFAYAVTLYQHHLTTFVILLSVYTLMHLKSAWQYMLIWFLCALSIVIDNPNFFFMFPIGVYALVKLIQGVKSTRKVSLVATLFVALVPIAGFMWFNQQANGSYFKLSGALKQAKTIDENGIPVDSIKISNESPEQVIQKKRDPVKYFKTRNMLNGFYILVMSKDRGVMNFAPVVLFGLIGLLLAIRNQIFEAKVFTGIILANFLIYMMWGDPWGGWAFGARYLIPSYAILCILIGYLMEKANRLYIILPVLALGLFSMGINLIGALSSNAVPPQVEVLELEKLSNIQQRFSYDRGWDMLNKGVSKSYVFNHLLPEGLPAINYYWILFAVLALTFVYTVLRSLNFRIRIKND